jgi:hypothetical protein
MRRYGSLIAGVVPMAGVDQLEMPIESYPELETDHDPVGFAAIAWGPEIVRSPPGLAVEGAD